MVYGWIKKSAEWIKRLLKYHRKVFFRFEKLWIYFSARFKFDPGILLLFSGQTMDKLRILIFLLEFLQIWFDEMTFKFYFLGRKQNLCLATAVVTLPCCIKVSSKWNLLSQKIEILFSSFFAKIFKCVRQSGVIGFDWRKEEIILEPKT
jgi:hypothetical protein